MFTKHQLTLFLSLVTMSLLFAPALRAQSCTFTATDVSFGGTDVLGTTPTDAAGNINVNCRAFLNLLSSIEMTVHLGDGQGGATPNYRTMTSPTTSTPLSYELYKDSGRTLVFGGNNGTHGGQPTTLSGGDILAILTSSGYNIPIYGRVPRGQTNIIPGSYTSSFPSTNQHVRVDYKTCNLGFLCSNRTANFSFAVRSQVAPDCRVEVGALDFGTHGFLKQAVDATGLIRVACTAQTSYQVGLGNGIYGSSVNQRQMRDLRGNAIRYQLYHDNARNLSWGPTGDGLATNLKGSGKQDIFTVYGRVPPQTTPPPGTYADTVVVTITY